MKKAPNLRNLIVKKILLCTMLVLPFLTFIANGQEVQSAGQAPLFGLSKTINGKTYKFEKTTIVKDSAGKRLDFDAWVSLVMTGEYDVKPSSPDENQAQEFLLYRKTAAEIEKEKANRAKPNIAKKSIISGLPISDFTFNDIKGNSYSNETLKGKMILFNFWFINCAPCVKEIPELNALQEKFKDKEIVFIAVSNIDSQSAIEKFLTKNKFNFDQISKEQAQGLNFIDGIDAFPTYMLVDSKGVIRHVSSGYYDEGIARLEKIIEAAMK